MTRRYSQIKKAAEYETALNNYTTYLKDAATRPTKRMQGGTKGASRPVSKAAVSPFGMDSSASGKILVSIGDKSKTKLATALGSTRLDLSNAGIAAANRLAGFRPAKVSAFEGSDAATYVQSKVTKLYYLKYPGDSFNAPFGATADTEEIETAMGLVRAAVVAVLTGDVKRISFSTEKVPG